MLATQVNDVNLFKNVYGIFIEAIWQIYLQQEA